MLLDVLASGIARLGMGVLTRAVLPQMSESSLNLHNLE